MSIHFISESKIDFLKTAIAKLNKKAIKCNCAEIKLEITTEFKMVKYIYEYDSEGNASVHSVPIDDSCDKSLDGEIHKLIKVIVEGEAPIIAGWKFLCRI